MLSCASSPSGSVNKGKRPPSSTAAPDTDNTITTTSTPQQHRQLLQFSFSRSKSCGEGRASSPSVDQLQLQLSSKKVPSMDETNAQPKRLTSSSTTTTTTTTAMNKNQGFTCGGALCVYLPTFSRSAKADKKPATQNEVKEATKTQVTTTTTVPDNQDYDSLFSKRISMAKFEWGSRSSAAIICNDDKDSYTDLTDKEDDDDEDSMNLYFDLPLELMRYAATDSPEKTAFIFTAYQGHEKTYDKTNSSDPLLSSSAKDLSNDISQQVRLSTE